MSENGNIRIIIAGGGTGGHIFPAIAIANAMKRMKPLCEILFVGAKGKMEMEKVPNEGYRIIGLDISGFNRSSIFKNITLPFKLIKSFMQARSIINEFNPDVVVGVGGYASFPVLYMAQQKKIPTLIQEQNSYAGKSNKILGKRAKAICVAYDNMERFFPKDKINLTGNPVRSNIANSTITHEQGIQFFSLDQNKKVVFAFGGSLGAKSINEALALSIPQLIEEKVQLVWQTGSTYFQTAQQLVKGHEANFKVFEFIREMDYAYAAADIIVSRAGASSISELCIVGKPVVFVPFPYASEDHQTHNAMALVSRNAALMVKDQEAKNELFTKIKILLKDQYQCELIKENIQQMKVMNADERIVNKLMEITV
jgi:UDP-N-acetylglucosamine--N-acetylmuramyl-(pentapeptide) pyrophosphoryl-undecaprenol N-acetylglucosamine transferase